MKENEQTGQVGANQIDLPGAAATIGALTAVAVFMAFYGSWSFSHGFFLQLGFSPSLVSIRTSIELFPNVGIGYTSGFLFLFIVGLLPSSPKKQSTFRAVMALTLSGFYAIVTLVSTIEPQSLIFKCILLICISLGPLSIGFIYRSLQHKGSIALTIATGFIVFNNHNYHLYAYGKDDALKVATEREYQFKDRGMSSSKLSEFPIVTVLSTSKLMFQTVPQERDGAYLYEPSGKSFIRLIIQDSTNAYFIERVGQNNNAIAISNSKIEQLLFHRLE